MIAFSRFAFKPKYQIENIKDLGLAQLTDLMVNMTLDLKFYISYHKFYNLINVSNTEFYLIL